MDGSLVQWVAIMMVTHSASELCSGWLSCPVGCNHDGYTLCSGCAILSSEKCVVHTYT